jgi:lysophospholipase L1-like esterase
MFAKRSLYIVITLATIAAGPLRVRPAGAAETAPASKPIRIVLVGDSTVSTYEKRPADKPDLTGWGQVFGDFFNDKVTVLNHAKSGRSTRSFIKEGLWKKALAAKGDYIFVQFGHNDSHLKDGRPAVDPATDFQSYLRQYIDEARAAGAKPVLITPVARRTFADGKIITGLQPYADAMLKVGKENNVPVIDLHAAAMRLFDRLGDAGSADMTASASDRTHFSRKGALAMARLVAEALPQSVPELRPYLKSVSLGETPNDAQPRFPIERAPAPLFDDPLWHGAADPTVIWAPDEKEWRIYYTQRRAALKNPNGVDWCHGSAIGIAASTDGIEWKYAGICRGDEGLGEPIERKCSWWAPCVIRHDGQFHLFVACVDGIYTKWTGKRTIKHFTSRDGKTWKYQMTLPLSSENCIDPCIYRIGDKWLVWYKDEGHGSRTYAAESPDLKNWKVTGPAVTDMHHEAPLVWRWKGAYWMIVDAWAGLRIYRSADGLGNWRYNTTILATPGKRAKDGVQGGHPFVLEQGDRPVAFYHVHFAKDRETVLQAAELDMDAAGKVICNRDKYAAAEY